MQRYLWRFKNSFEDIGPVNETYWEWKCGGCQKMQTSNTEALVDRQQFDALLCMNCTSNWQNQSARYKVVVPSAAKPRTSSTTRTVKALIDDILAGRVSYGTKELKGLTEQLIEAMALFPVEEVVTPGQPPLRRGPLVRIKSRKAYAPNAGTQLYVFYGISDSTEKGFDGAPSQVTVDSGYRTAIQQYVLQAAKSKNSNPVAPPGRSSHHAGMALDITRTGREAAFQSFKKHGWKPLAGDPPHISKVKAELDDVRKDTVRAFQRLYNFNAGPTAKKLAEDGIWGPKTRAAADSAPVNGYSKSLSPNMTNPAPTRTPLIGPRSIDSRGMQVGDLILSTSDGITSEAIRWGTDSSVSHAALYIGNGRMVEAIPEGVLEAPLSAALGDDSLAVVVRYPGLTTQQGSRIADFARQAASSGAQYNTFGIVRQALFLLWTMLGGSDESARGFLGRIDLGSDENQWFCSEFIVDAYRASGVLLLPADAKWVTPKDLHNLREGDFTNLGSLNGKLAYVGHLKG